MNVIVDRKLAAFRTAAALLLLLSSGCSTDVGAPVDGPSAAAQPEASSAALSSEQARQPVADESAPLPVSVSWASTNASEHGAVFSADVLNNSAERTLVQLQINAETPNGDVATVDLGKMVLAPNTSRGVTIAARQIPVQSVGAPTAVTLVATFAGKPGPDLVGDGKVFGGGDVQAFTEARYVTFDDDFGAATLRTSEEQGRVNGQNGGGSELAALRVLEAKTGALVEQTVGGGGPDEPRATNVATFAPGTGPVSPTE